MHGGNIMAHSNEKGTTFTVTLPKRDTSQYHPAVPAVAADEKEISSTLVDAEIQAGDEALEEDCPIVLVIDDNADIRHYVKLRSNDSVCWMRRMGQYTGLTANTCLMFPSADAHMDG